MAPNAEFFPRVSSPELVAALKLRASSFDDFVTHMYYELVPE